jgi:hypothetical protein
MPILYAHTRHSYTFAVLIATFIALFLSTSLALADDMVSFATGGYASGLRTASQMNEIDTDHDGNITKAEWLAYQNKVFDVLDTNHDGTLNAKKFLGPSTELVTFATGGYAHGLQTREMMHKIDVDGDGEISRQEWIDYQTQIFDMMDKDKKSVIESPEFLGR